MALNMSYKEDDDWVLTFIAQLNSKLNIKKMNPTPGGCFFNCFLLPMTVDLF